MSTPAPPRERAPAAEPPLAPLPAPPPRPERRLRSALALPVLFVLAAAYHAVQSTGHATPAIFTDELLHSELARSFAAGDGFRVRDAPLFFPAFLPALLQAPAWLVADAETAYAAAKILNALVMSAAVFPAYGLARMLVRPTYALLVAAATVASPALLYHGYLLSEALAYPVFLLAFGVLVRALARPSLLWSLAAVGASLLAVGTRVQFVALPLAFALLALARPRLVRRHAPATALLALFALAAAAVGGRALLGTYNGVLAVDVSAGAVGAWAAKTTLLLPFAAGLLVVPGALLGLALLAARPQTSAEAAFARLALLVGAAFVGQAGVIAAADAERPLERYAVYLAPLAALSFFAYAERGLPYRHAALALAGALTAGAWLVPFATLADYRFSFDSPVLSAFGHLAHLIGTANAATIFAAAPLLALVALAVRARPGLVGGATIALLFAAGLAAYAADHGMTERARTAWAGSPPDWLDRGGYGRADLLALPGGAPHFGWTLEAWNRDFGRPVLLGVKPPRNDPWPHALAEVADDGTLLVDGGPARAGLLVVNDHATQIGLEGEVVARPRNGLTLVRVPEGPRVRWLATGLHFDRWAGGRLVYRAWPERPAVRGLYHVRVSLPPGLPARPITFQVERGARRTATLAGGEAIELALPVRGGGGPTPALVLETDRAELLDGGANPRLVGFRVERLEYEPSRPVRPFRL